MKMIGGDCISTVFLNCRSNGRLLSIEPLPEEEMGRLGKMQERSENVAKRENNWLPGLSNKEIGHR